MKKVFISIIESLYLIYMFRYFKTSINFDILKICWVRKSSKKTKRKKRVYKLKLKYLEHDITNTYGVKICPFGQDAILLLIVVLLLQNVIPIRKTEIIYSLYIALGLSLLMNWNAFVYILPVFIIEKYIH